jgi:hypothetical protein
MSLTISRRLLLAGSLVASLGRPPLLTAQTPEILGPGGQLDRYRSDRDALLASGRATVDALLEANDADFSSVMAHPDLAAVSATSELAWLQTNRLRLRWSDPSLVIDGHFDGSGTIAALAWRAGGPTTLVLTAESDQAQPMPTGRWTGVLDQGSVDFPVTISFEGDEDGLSATLDAPDQGLSALPASGAVLFPELPVGDRIQDTALPLGESNQVYRAEYAWGDALLGFDVAFDADLMVVGFGVALRALLPPDPALHLEPAATYRLPSQGPVLVAWGGPTELQNHHASTPSQRHALDLLAWANGATSREGGMENGDYLIWGSDVLAPAAGTVVARVSDEPDVPPFAAQTAAPAAATPAVATAEANPLGNHVVVEIAPGTYVIVAHLQHASIELNVGDRVSAGDRLGLVGNSGNSSEPHIHIHAQNQPDPYDPTAIGLPLTFSTYLADGQLVSSGSPVQGQFVEQQ